MQTIAEIKTAVKNGKKVHWHNAAYTVIVNRHEQYLIKHSGGHCVGLTEEYKPADFYAEETAAEQLDPYHYYIEYLNAKKNHARDRVDFATYEEAKEWGRANIEHFHSDMVRININ